MNVPSDPMIVDLQGDNVIGYMMNRLLPPQRSEAERSDGSRSGGSSSPGVDSPSAAATPKIPRSPDPEVPARATRRHFSTRYKLSILEQAAACKTPGSIGSLLRREGLYSSHLSAWRDQREAGALDSQSVKKRGPKPEPVNPLARQVAYLKKEMRRAERKLIQAQAVIEYQKKLSKILGISLEKPGIDDEA